MKGLILAGGVLPPGDWGHYKVKHQALLPLKGKPMVEYVVDALFYAPAIEQLVLVGPEDLLPDAVKQKVDLLVPAGKSIFASLENGLAAVAKEKQVLISACDLPLLTPALVEEFLQKAEERHLKLAYSYVGKADSEKSFPGFPHTYVRLKEGIFCGGGVFLFPLAAIFNLKELLQQLTRFRKEPLKLAFLLGISVIFKMLLGILRVEELEQKAESLLGVKAGGIISPPEFAFNVDNLIQYQFALRLLQEK